MTYVPNIPPPGHKQGHNYLVYEPHVDNTLPGEWQRLDLAAKEPMGNVKLSRSL